MCHVSGGQLPAAAMQSWRIKLPKGQLGLNSRACNVGLDIGGVKFANMKKISFLGVEQAWTPIIYLKSFDIDPVQVGKAVFVRRRKKSYTTLGKRS